ncbi:MAG: hypothetical protein Kow0062_23490 [Acidobacteriota bacterium]
MEFDLYCHQPETLEAGAVVALDGCDGFCDQYFERRRAGEVIRFLVLADGPAATPESASQLEALPLVHARVRGCTVIAGEVEILSVDRFGAWLASARLPAVSRKELKALEPMVPISELIARAAAEGVAYWRAGRPYWRSLDEVTAVLAVSASSGTRIGVLRTNAIPGMARMVESAG